MASVNVNCCEGMTIQKLLCNCNWGKRKKDDTVMYTDKHKQIVILSTPQHEMSEFVTFPDLQTTDIVVFCNDEKNELRFVSLQGRNLFKYIDSQPFEFPQRQSMVAGTPPPTARILSNATPPVDGQPVQQVSFRKSTAEHKVHPSISVPENVAGRSFADILPEYMHTFFGPICKQTLQGNFLQLTIMWDGFTSVIRTFPVQDHKKRIVSGITIISPFNAVYSTDINRFSVGNIDSQTKPDDKQ